MKLGQKTTKAKKPGSGRAAVVDFDNTLFFTDECTIMASKDIYGRLMSIKEIRSLPKPEKHRIYRLGFDKYHKKSRPNLPMINKLKKSSATLILLTARSKDDSETITSLIASSGLEFNRLIFRPKKYLIGHDEEWKLGELGKISQKYEEIEFYEDKIENIMHAKKNIGSRNIQYFRVSGASIRRV
jgi:hypothetical protein